MIDEMKQRILMQLRLRKTVLFCGHTSEGICDACRQNITGTVSDIQGDVSDIRGDVSYIWGDVSYIRGNVSDIRGNVSDISGTVSDIIAVLKEKQTEAST